MAKLIKEICLYNKTTGLNTKKTNQELVLSEDGTVELSTCANAHITDSGKLVRKYDSFTRFGVISPLVTAAFHKKQFVVLAIDGKLYSKFGDAIFIQMATGLHPINPTAMTVFGNMLYVSDGVICTSYTSDFVQKPWSFTAKYGAVNTRVYSSPPPHKKSFSAFGRIFCLTSDNIIFYSEPLAPNMFRKATNVIWDRAGIKDCDGINGCILVSTPVDAFILSGSSDFTQLQKTVISNSPLKENSICTGKVDDADVICYATKDGLWVVDQSGKPVNLTVDTLPGITDYITCATITDEKYIVSFYGNGYIVNLRTKAVSKFEYIYTHLFGDYGIQEDGLVCDYIVNGKSENPDLPTITQVTFAPINLGTSLNKKLQNLIITGNFSKESKWTVENENGKKFTAILPAQSRLIKKRLILSTKVSGEYLTISFETAGNFDLDSIYFTPILTR